MSTPSSKITQKLQNYLHRRHGDMIELVETLVKSESPSTVPDSQNSVFACLESRLNQLDYQVQRIKGQKTGGLVMAFPKSYQENQPLQLLVGHCDTVWSLGTLEKMPVYQRGGKLYGPGTYDMKGGLVQSLFAIEALKAHEIPLKFAPVFLINSDEEIGSPESRPYVKQLAQQASRAFVMEPSLGPEGKLKTQRKGTGHFVIRVVGKAAHAGLEPEKGASAILELSLLIPKIFALNDPDKGITVNVGTIDGGVRPNVIAPESQAVLDVRFLKLKDGEAIKSQLLALQPITPNTQVIVEGYIEHAPMEKTPESEQLWQLAQQAGSELGIDLEEATAGGSSDGNTTSLYTPTLDGLGAVGDAAHAPGEFVYLDQLIERSALLARLLMS